MKRIKYTNKHKKKINQKTRFHQNLLTDAQLTMGVTDQQVFHAPIFVSFFCTAELSLSLIIHQLVLYFLFFEI